MTDLTPTESTGSPIERQLWRAVLNEAEESDWRMKAKCAGNPAAYDTETVVRKAAARHAVSAETLAQNLCAGCPVKRACAAEGCLTAHTGMVRAGIPFQDGGAGRRRQMQALQVIASGKAQ